MGTVRTRCAKNPITVLQYVQHMLAVSGHFIKSPSLCMVSRGILTNTFHYCHNKKSVTTDVIN